MDNTENTVRPVMLITGASRGIGRAIAQAAVARFDLFLVGNANMDALEQTAALLRAQEPCAKVVTCRADVSSRSQVRDAFCRVRAEMKRLDVLVNCAGISERKLMQDTSEADWKRVFAVNTDGVFFCTQEAVDLFLEQGGDAKIINVSSVWGRIGGAMESCYSASKAAIIGFTQALAKELALSDITVTAVAPGAIDTDMMGGYTADEIDDLTSRLSIGRLGRPEEVAEVVMMLACAKTHLLTGAVVDLSF